MKATLQQDFFDRCNRALQRCHDCGSRVVMRYDPGVTWIHCLGCQATKMSRPDWQPGHILEDWND